MEVRELAEEVERRRRYLEEDVMDLLVRLRDMKRMVDAREDREPYLHVDGLVGMMEAVYIFGGNVHWSTISLGKAIDKVKEETNNGRGSKEL